MRQRLTPLLAIAFLLAASVAIVVLYRRDVRRAPIRAAESFFELIANERLYDAFRTTSSVIRGESFELFERSILENGLQMYQSATWRMLRKGTGNEERMQGEIRTSDGETRPFTVSMVREAGKWRVYSIVSEQRGAVFRRVAEEPEMGAPPEAPPTDAQARALVLDTLLRFNEAVQIRYFGPFYHQISTSWQRQTSPEDLERAFAAFIENRISFGLLSRAEPVFTEPIKLSPEGLLLLAGDCQTDLYTIRFSTKYLYERGKWRLFGIELNLVRADAQPGAQASPAGASGRDSNGKP